MVGKRPLDKGGEGGVRSVWERFRGRGVSWEGTGRVWEERIHGRKASGEGGGRTGASGAAGGRGFALGVWLVGKVLQGAPGASGRKKVAAGRNVLGGSNVGPSFTCAGTSHGFARTPLALLSCLAPS